jgi:hypothetical protein
MMKANNRNIEPGTELSFKGETGRFIFRWMTGDDLTCWGGRQHHEMYRSFSPDHIKRVHSKPKLRANLDK